jgi:hypothetical protein
MKMKTGVRQTKSVRADINLEVVAEALPMKAIRLSSWAHDEPRAHTAAAVLAPPSFENRKSWRPT